MLRRIFLFLLGTMVLLAAPRAAFAQPAAAQPQAAEPSQPSPPPTLEARRLYVETLRARAKQLRLGEDVQWRRLGHYKKNTFSGYTGTADQPGWYVAKDGDSDPVAELDATIEAIFLGSVPKEKNGQHPLCKYPARLLFLTQHIPVDAAMLPQADCSRFGEFLEKIRPARASIVFSSYYLNAPASAFGHTFLHIEKAGFAATREKRELLDFGIDYAAEANTSNAVLYAVKGLAGLFPGYFKALPYYYKVREYNDFESRDLWEYDLSLTPEQLVMLAAHLWELGSTYFDYYYLSENCSYHVLAAVEAVNPKLHLLEHLKYPIIPADTIKALYQNPGLVANVRYRPSLRTVFETRVKDLSSDERAALEEVAEKPDTSLDAFSDDAKIHILDAAADLVDMRFAKDLVQKGAKSPGAALKQRILERRAKILKPSADLVMPFPERRQPHLGHGSARLDVGSGYSTLSGGAFVGLGGRLALHDLADPTLGYPELADIEFLPTRVRAYPGGRTVELEDLQLLKVRSLNPVSRYRFPLAFAFQLGGTRLRDEGCRDCFAPDIAVSGGVSFSTTEERFTLYGLIRTETAAHSRMNGLFDSAFRLGSGPSLGFRLRFAEKIVWTAAGNVLFLPFQDPWYVPTGETSFRWSYAHDMALGLEGKVSSISLDGTLASYFYF